jgi:hypothetical protein
MKINQGAAVIYLVGVDSTKIHDIFKKYKNRSNIPADNGSPSNTLIIIKPTRQFINIRMVDHTVLLV